MRSGYGVLEPGGLVLLGETATGRIFVGCYERYKPREIIRREYRVAGTPIAPGSAAGSSEMAGLNMKILKRVSTAAVRKVLRRTDVRASINESLTWYEAHGD